jgi:glycosyltransferase involved in cell wall biosynthesis
MIDSVAAIGDVADINCWSGLPWHFAHAAQRKGERAVPWRLEMGKFGSARRGWNIGQLLRGRGLGGYQYSSAFLEKAEATIPFDHWHGRVVTFNQHFPRSRSVAERGGSLMHYIDATFASLCGTGGLAARLPARVRSDALALECENYARSERVVTMARWAAESAIRDCGAPKSKVATILPGANFNLPPDYSFPKKSGQAGRDRPIKLGFVGKDWRRKGLPFLLQVRSQLERMGSPATVSCAGFCPPELMREKGMEHVGFIDKKKDPARFLAFLTDCDVGCLFSEAEPLGISTLEFLHAGVPVTGFMVGGIVDTVPPDAGFRVRAQATAEEVASMLREAFRDESTIEKYRSAARRWSPLVTWERCVDEWNELLTTGSVMRPVRPWLGLNSMGKES